MSNIPTDLPARSSWVSFLALLFVDFRTKGSELCKQGHVWPIIGNVLSREYPCYYVVRASGIQPLYVCSTVLTKRLCRQVFEIVLRKCMLPRLLENRFRPHLTLSKLVKLQSCVLQCSLHVGYFVISSRVGYLFVNPYPARSYIFSLTVILSYLSSRCCRHGSLSRSSLDGSDVSDQDEVDMVGVALDPNSRPLAEWVSGLVGATYFEPCKRHLHLKRNEVGHHTRYLAFSRLCVRIVEVHFSVPSPFVPSDSVRKSRLSEFKYRRRQCTFYCATCARTEAMCHQCLPSHEQHRILQVCFSGIIAALW